MTTDLKSVGLLTKRGTDKITPVVADEGALRGLKVGKTREGWDDRVDAKATAYEIHVRRPVAVDPSGKVHHLLGLGEPALLKGLGIPKTGLWVAGNRAIPVVSGGAFSASGVFALTERDIKQNDTAVDMLADTIKLALFSNSVTTPNYDTNTAYGAAPFNANEASGTGYTAGGAAVANDTYTISSGNLIYDGDDTSWTGATFGPVRGALLYDDTITTPVADPAVAGIGFGADYSVTAGTFTIQHPAGGILVYDLS